MTHDWNPNDLELIGAADEPAVAPTRADGTPRPYTTIWVVRVGGDVYVRSYRGRAAGWYRAAERSRRGRIRVAGLERDVTFEHPGSETVNADVDDAYRDKYGRSGYVNAMVNPDAAATTLRLVPR